MATLNLGRIKPVFRGAYNSATAYVVDDIVTFGDETFICILASTGNATSNATYWTKLAAKGTDGTDVGTVITTQGDILYRDGSGLARLGAGTSGYYLKTQGTGANPVWSEVTSGGLVQVASASGSGGTVQAFNSCFSSSYEHYKIVANISVGGTTQVYMRLQNASNTEVNADYYGAGYTNSRSSTANGGGDMGFWNAAEFQVQENIDAASSRFGTYIIYVMSPFNSSAKTNILVNYSAYDSSNFRTVRISGTQETVGSMAGFRFFASQNIQSASTFKIYGFN